MRKFVTVLAALALGLAACSGGPGASTGGDGAEASVGGGDGGSQPAASVGGGQASSGEATVDGSLTSSGEYDGTWTWVPGNAADPGTGGVTLTSDKGDFGNVQVLADGSISFSSGATDLIPFTPFTGTGAIVFMKNDAPCRFTLDNDLTGSENKILHLTGTLELSGGVFC